LPKKRNPIQLMKMDLAGNHLSSNSSFNRFMKSMGNYSTLEDLSLSRNGLVLPELECMRYAPKTWLASVFAVQKLRVLDVSYNTLDVDDGKNLRLYIKAHLNVL
jgi:hypothetical protein